MTERDERGRFKKENHYSPETEFEEGKHWREEKSYWNEEWLREEYVDKQKSASEIAENFDCTAKNIRYFLRKYDIPIRNISEARKVKEWGASGKENGMYGRNGKDNPHWKGGITSERQSLYSSQEWSEVTKKVWKRDNAKCQRCNKEKENEVEFHIHHIIPFEVEEKRMDIDNLILLCKECHNWVHSSKNKNNKYIEEVNEY